jgi:hypothetical protein
MACPAAPRPRRGPKSLLQVGGGGPSRTSRSSPSGSTIQGELEDRLGPAAFRQVMALTADRVVTSVRGSDLVTHLTPSTLASSSRARGAMIWKR